MEEIKLSTMDYWYKRMPGSMLLEMEQERLDAVLPKIHGNFIIQNGDKHPDGVSFFLIGYIQIVGVEYHAGSSIGANHAITGECFKWFCFTTGIKNALHTTDLIFNEIAFFRKVLVLIP